VTFNNYGGTCRYEYRRGSPTSPRPRGASGHRRAPCSAIAKMPGLPGQQGTAVHTPHRRGVADNIGIRSVWKPSRPRGRARRSAGDVGSASSAASSSSWWNARSGPKTEWDHNETPPGPSPKLLQASGVPIDRYSFETVEMMKDRQEMLQLAARNTDRRARRLAGATEAQAEGRRLPAEALAAPAGRQLRGAYGRERASLFHETCRRRSCCGRGHRQVARSCRATAAPIRGLPGDAAEFGGVPPH